MEKTWRDAKIPKWVTESVEDDLYQFRLTAALSWPTEAKPAPKPFQWGDYDHLHGSPEEGVYWGTQYRSHVSRVEIKKNISTWKAWQFQVGSNGWTTQVFRGPLFDTEREARLYLLWEKCESVARELMNLRAKL